MGASFGGGGGQFQFHIGVLGAVVSFGVLAWSAPVVFRPLLDKTINICLVQLSCPLIPRPPSCPEKTQRQIMFFFSQLNEGQSIKKVISYELFVSFVMFMGFPYLHVTINIFKLFPPPVFLQTLLQDHHRGKRSRVASETKRLRSLRLESAGIGGKEIRVRSGIGRQAA